LIERAPLKGRAYRSGESDDAVVSTYPILVAADRWSDLREELEGIS
jgi:hypothetical protein